MLAVLGVAVASDTTTTKEKPAIANSTILLFDASKSMGNVSSSMGNASGNMSTTHKIDNAKIAVKMFMSGLDPATNEVALIVFYDCGRIVLEVPFTTKQSVIALKIDKIKPTGSTPLSAAIVYAMDYMRQKTDGSTKKIILFTDSEETCPYKAIYKGAENVSVSIIGFDIPKGSDQESKLLEFAKKIGGTYLDAENASSPTALTISLQQSYAGISALNNAMFLVAKGIALQSMGNNDNALIAFDKALELDPEYAMVRYAKGADPNAQGNNDEGLMVFDGLAFENLGKYDEAIIAFDKALKLNPKHTLVWYSKGFVLATLGKYYEAVQSYDKAIELDPKDADSWHNKGVALQNLGKYDEAIIAFDKSLELDPEYAMAWYNKGAALANQRRYDEAIKAFDEAIQLDPNYAQAWSGKGSVLKLLGKTTESNAAYARAKELALLDSG